MLSLIILLTSKTAISKCNQELVLFTQNETSSVSDEKVNSCLHLNGISVGGYALGAKKGITFADFFEYSPTELSEIIDVYLSRVGIQNPRQYTGWILLDIEHPLHLNKLSTIVRGKLEADYLRSIVLRTQVVRKALPKATISMYGIYTPNFSCKENIDIEASAEALIYFAGKGMLNFVDYVSPVLYLRNSVEESNERSNVGCQMSNFARFSQLLKRDRSVDVTLLPLLSLAIYNGRSQDNGDQLNSHLDGPNDAMLLYQFSALLSHEQKVIGIWSPPHQILKKKGLGVFYAANLAKRICAEFGCKN